MRGLSVSFPSQIQPNPSYTYCGISGGAAPPLWRPSSYPCRPVRARKGIAKFGLAILNNETQRVGQCPLNTTIPYHTKQRSCERQGAPVLGNTRLCNISSCLHFIFCSFMWVMWILLKLLFRKIMERKGGTVHISCIPRCFPSFLSLFFVLAGSVVKGLDHEP